MTASLIPVSITIPTFMAVLPLIPRGIRPNAVKWCNNCMFCSRASPSSLPPHLSLSLSRSRPFFRIRHLPTPKRSARYQLIGDRREPCCRTAHPSPSLDHLPSNHTNHARRPYLSAVTLLLRYSRSNDCVQVFTCREQYRLSLTEVLRRLHQKLKLSVVQN